MEILWVKLGRKIRAYPPNNYKKLITQLNVMKLALEF
jgi:hypothetical protein